MEEIRANFIACGVQRRVYGYGVSPESTQLSTDSVLPREVGAEIPNLEFWMVMVAYMAKLLEGCFIKLGRGHDCSCLLLRSFIAAKPARETMPPLSSFVFNPELPTYAAAVSLKQGFPITLLLLSDESPDREPWCLKPEEGTSAYRFFQKEPGWENVLGVLVAAWAQQELHWEAARRFLCNLALVAMSVTRIQVAEAFDSFVAVDEYDDKGVAADRVLVYGPGMMKEVDAAPFRIHRCKLGQRMPYGDVQYGLQLALRGRSQFCGQGVERGDGGSLIFFTHIKWCHPEALKAAGIVVPQEGAAPAKT